MTGVVFVFVRQDASEAEALAEAFDAAGFPISGGHSDETAVNVIIWSRAAARCSAFNEAVESALHSGRAVIASLNTPPPPGIVRNAMVIDLGDWDGEDGPALDPLFEAVSRVARPLRPKVIVLPAPQVYEDAEFTELAPDVVGENERIERARRSWVAPIPTEMLRPSHDEPPAPTRARGAREEPVVMELLRPLRQDPPAPKRGATQPRRDFRRLRPLAQTHAPLIIAAVVLIGGGVFAVSFAPTPAPQAGPEYVEQMGAVTFAAASADAAELGDPLPPVEPEPEMSRARLEPPSANTARRAAPRLSARHDRAIYLPPALIPEPVDAALQPAPTLVAEQPVSPRS